MPEPTGLLLESKHFAVHDGPGIRTTFFFKGCPLRCLWCHNPESVERAPQLGFFSHKCRNCGRCAAVCPEGAHTVAEGAHTLDRAKCRVCGACVANCPAEALKVYGERRGVAEVVEEALADRDFYDNSGGGVTLSGGEPLMQGEFALALLAALKAAGLHTALDSSLFAAPELVRATLPVTDMYLIDFKHADPAEHRKFTGQANGRIVENLRMLSDAGARIEIRIPFVPGCNADDANMAATGRILGEMRIERIRLLPYHSHARFKYAAVGRPDTMPDAESPDEAAIGHACSILRQYGLEAVSGRA